MPKEKIHFIQGPVMFAKVFPGNKDTGKYAPEGGQYTIDIGVDTKTKKLIKSWNRSYGEKEYKEPYDDAVDPKLDYFSFKRKHEARKRNGELIEEWSGAPKVVDNQGNEWSKDASLIGNGSLCTLKLAVFSGIDKDGGTFTIVRLEGVRVDELVEFASSSGGEDDEGGVEYPDGIPF